MRDLFWGGKWDSNPRQPESQSGTLPTELFPPEFEFCGLPGRDRTCDHLLRRQVLYPTELRADRPGVQLGWKLVGVKRFELPTSCSQSRRATRLRYTPGRNRILHEIRKNATGNQQAGEPQKKRNLARGDARSMERRCRMLWRRCAAVCGIREKGTMSRRRLSPLFIGKRDK